MVETSLNQITLQYIDSTLNWTFICIHCFSFIFQTLFPLFYQGEYDSSRETQVSPPSQNFLWSGRVNFLSYLSLVCTFRKESKWKKLNIFVSFLFSYLEFIECRMNLFLVSSTVPGTKKNACEKWMKSTNERLYLQYFQLSHGSFHH